MEAWQPDAACIAAGDDNLTLALRCCAAGMLSDAQIAQRVLDLAGVPAPINTPEEYSIEIGAETAAVVIARHLALCGMCTRDIVLVLADFGGTLPGWPSAVGGWQVPHLQPRGSCRSVHQRVPWHERHHAPASGGVVSAQLSAERRVQCSCQS